MFMDLRAALPDPTDVPPTASLASLSLNQSPESATLPTPAPAPPKNKLAAKMAANRAAKAAAAAASASSPAPSAPSAPSPIPQAAQPPEKKLSKLQQKMLSSRAAKAVPPAPSWAPAAELAPEPLAVASAPLPDLNAPVEESMAVDSSAFSSTALVAAPSPFANALTPSHRAFLAPVAHRIASTVPLSIAVEPSMAARFGPSPDDKVLEARKGTALGVGARGGVAGAARMARK